MHIRCSHVIRDSIKVLILIKQTSLILINSQFKIDHVEASKASKIDSFKNQVRKCSHLLNVAKSGPFLGIGSTKKLRFLKNILIIKFPLFF